MDKTRFFIILLGVISLIPFTSASHFIVGAVNNSLSGEQADGYLVTLWNPANGLSDNLTDIIGPTGNSGANNIYLFDCELLSNGCSIGDTLNIKVFNNGSNYLTETTSVIVTGSGFDAAPNLRLNSPPTLSLNSPQDSFITSETEIELMCTASDLDGNLANTTLYGTWSGGWHANETLASTGSTNTTSFTKNLEEGIYEWSCLATDSLSISAFSQENFTFTIDLTPPEITSFGLNVSEKVCGTTESVRVNCTVQDSLSSVKNVIIKTNKPSGEENHPAQLLSGDTYFADILIDELGDWRFTCIAEDFANNSASTNPINLTGYSQEPDLAISSEQISFSDSSPAENVQITLNAEIFNNGCSDANNFLAAFFENDPAIDGIQIGENQTLSIPGFGSTIINTTITTKIGPTNLFVSTNLENSISEFNETNNKANKTLTVGAWQEFYGKITMDWILGDGSVNNLSLWLNDSSPGNLFIVDSESEMSWESLQAIGKNSLGENTTNDFSEIDSMLNMSALSDSVSNIFTLDGITPIQTQDFTINGQTISGVPVITSINSANFITGIVWDTSTDSNGEFDSEDKENIIFITKINPQTQGTYGTYDYEIKIPARLREYYTQDAANIFIYFDIN